MSRSFPHRALHLSPLALLFFAAGCSNSSDAQSSSSGTAAGEQAASTASNSTTVGGAATTSSTNSVGGQAAASAAVTTGSSTVSGAGGASAAAVTTGSTMVTASVGGSGGSAGSGGTGSAGASATVPGTELYDCSPPEGTVPTLTKQTIASNLLNPTLVTHAGSDPRLFVAEQGGRIRIVQDGELLATPFLDINDKVASTEDDEQPGGTNRDRGLVGLAFHPNYAENGVFYVHYQAMQGTTAYETGTTVIAEYTVSAGDPNLADPASENVLISHPQPGEDHNGGTITFGSDSMLYIGLGDGKGWVSFEEQLVDPDGNAQNPQTPLASILRINPSPTPGGTYSVPAGNLKETVPEADERVWDYGLRNPFRMNFDGCTGVLYIGDVGRTAFEEVDIELPGDGRKNYGWPIMEGAECFEAGCDQTGLTPPMVSYPWENGVSVIGGAVYRGRAIPALRGTYVYADFYYGKLLTLSFDAAQGTVTEGADLVSISAPTSIQNGPDGEIYMTSYTDGALYKLAPL